MFSTMHYHVYVLYIGMTLFGRIGGLAALPCTRLGLCATQFIDLPARDDRASILSFFASKDKDKVCMYVCMYVCR